MKIKKARSLEKMEMHNTVWRKKDIFMSHVHRDWEKRCGTKEPGIDLALEFGNRVWKH